MGLKVMAEKITRKHIFITMVVFIFFMAAVLPYVDSLLGKLIGVSDSPDTMFFPTKDELYDLAFYYGRSGREIYIKSRFTFDVIWPTVYTMFFFFSYLYLSKKSNYKISLKWAYLPLIAGCLDMFENIMASIYFTRWPWNHVNDVNVLIFAINAKWIVIGITMIMLVITYIRVLIIRRK